MRALIATWAGGGNVPPAAALARRLLDAGHSVAVIGHESVRSQFPPEADFTVYRQAPDFADSREVGGPARTNRTPIGEFAELRDRLLLGPADRFAADTAELIEAFAAEVLIADFMVVGALVAAEAAGVPSIALMHTIYSLPCDGVPPLGPGWQPARGRLGRTRDRAVDAVTRRLWDRGLAPLNRARAELGLSPLATVFDQLDSVAHTIVTSSPAFDFGGARRDRVTYVGLLADDRPVTPWRHPRHDLAHLPLVVVSYSTTDQGQAAALRRAAAALGRLPVRGVVTCGPVVDPVSLDAPENVAVERFVDHRAVLRDAAVLVSHGGHGSVVGALRAGAPVVCVPQGRDQHDVAARLVATGAGLRVPARSSPRRLAAAIGRVLADDGIRAAAAAVARAMAAEAVADPVAVVATSAGPSSGLGDAD